MLICRVLNSKCRISFFIFMDIIFIFYKLVSILIMSSARYCYSGGHVQKHEWYESIFSTWGFMLEVFDNKVISVFL